MKLIENKNRTLATNNLQPKLMPDNFEIANFSKNFIPIFETYLEEFSESTINKGKKILAANNNTFEHEILGPDEGIDVTIPSESLKKTKYLVNIDFIDDDLDYLEDLDLIAICNCPAYNNYDECKHQAAAILWYMNKCLNRQTITTTAIISSNTFVNHNTTEGVFKIIGDSIFDIEKKIKALYPKNVITSKDLNSIQLVKEDDNNKNKIVCIVKDGSKRHETTIEYDGQFTIENTCSCSIGGNCFHVGVIAVYLQYKFNNWFRDRYLFIAEKQALANQYSVPIDADLINQCTFEFSKYPDRIISYTPKNIFNNLDNASSISKILNNNDVPTIQKITTPQNFGFIINLYKPPSYSLFNFKIIPVQLDANGLPKAMSGIIDIFENTHIIKTLPSALFATLANIMQQGLVKYAIKTGQFRTLYENSMQPFQYMIPEQLKIISNYIVQNIIDSWQQIAAQEFIFINADNTSNRINNYQQVQLSTQPYKLAFNLVNGLHFLELHNQIVLPNLPDDATKTIVAGFVLCNNILYPPATVQDYNLVAELKGMGQYFTKNLEAQVQAAIVNPLIKQYNFAKNGVAMPIVKIEATPVPRLVFSEADSHLLLTPQMVYDDIVMNVNNFTNERILDGNTIYELSRNELAEKDLDFDTIMLHDSFITQGNPESYSISFGNAKSEGWFLKAIDTLQQKNIEVYGTQNLKAFNINPNKAKWEMKASSGQDWFDINIEVSFGDEVASLSDVRKALMDGSNIVKLKDGTLGMLPQEWAKQYGLILKMGNVQANNVKLSKLHFTLIDSLYDQLDDATLQAELTMRKQKLLNIDKVKTKPVSKKINATLRDYQQTGLAWLQVLDEVSWGACLADDMGLGKTLQTIAFIQYVKEKYKKGTQLIICPTSLIYNWESELIKFAPHLTFIIHYGNSRTSIEDNYNNVDIVITTYGTLRSDIATFAKIDWQYVVLDESQAIKNPTALTTKAVQLLKAQNRIALSGTPLQNNTFDLYAQFQFLNPGLLGSAEIFKNTFANPIDKNNDADASKQLKQMLFPFILRRTKEQVATELPPKIESILWCEMDTKQRKVYDDYKNHYRDVLLKKIDEVGMAKAGIYVIEGLLRLRQICDSPQLVKNEKVTTTSSIKTQELLRELKENTGQNKVLVFSQFVEMLSLVKDALDTEGMSYCYLDGSTSAQHRKAAVHEFQTNDDKKIFLMSIKAGGVGLNLTQANYVYIIDPWWNPAVEQQAIDRTHRIGQKNQIFAYRMICKNTVEEKIIALQQKKKQVADDLITEDAGFVKKLTKTDVAFLFS
jgi:SNF2 family DNA or RNA helicase